MKTHDPSTPATIVRDCDDTRNGLYICINENITTADNNDITNDNEV